MTTPITQFSVPFDALNFTRNGNNLIVSNGAANLATYENFFNGDEMGTVTTITTKDGTTDFYTSHNILNEATILVKDVANYQGYNVFLGDDTYTGYKEEVTVKYDENQYTPQGQSPDVLYVIPFQIKLSHTCTISDK